jgi:hypothetical protein
MRNLFQRLSFKYLLFLEVALIFVGLSGVAARAQAVAEPAAQPALQAVRAQECPYVSPQGTSVDELIESMKAGNLELQAARKRVAQAEGLPHQGKYLSHARCPHGFQERKGRE